MGAVGVEKWPTFLFSVMAALWLAWAERFSFLSNSAGCENDLHQ
jgi:hypothetical protein